jgi:hypothetical protein
MTRVSKLAGPALLALLCLPLGGCFGDNAASQEPPLPPVLYVVTQHSDDGNKQMVRDIATSYYWTDGGCIYYVNPDDPKNADRRVVCGGLIRVLPQQAAH